MGKATIVSHLGGARYSIIVHQDDARLDEMIQAAQDQLDLLAPELIDAQAEYDQAVVDYQQALSERDDDINLAIPGVPVPEELAKSINEKTNEISLWFDILGKAEFKLKNIKARILTLEKRVEWLQSLYNSDPLPSAAYCVDLSDGEPDPVTEVNAPVLAGDVATVTPYRRGDEVFLINGNTPTFRPDPAYDAATDGTIVPVYAMSPAQFLYNYAMWPGAEAWLDFFHVGYVTAKNKDTQTLDVQMEYLGHIRKDGLEPSYSQLEVLYMGCGYKAFQGGDRVVVAKKAAWTEPKVVGFAQQPRACPLSLDFLVHATTEAEYWLCSYDEGTEAWTKTLSSRIAGSTAWIGPGGKCISTEYLDHKVFENGTALVMPTWSNLGNSSIEPIYPFRAGRNENGHLVVIGAWVKWLYKDGFDFFSAQVSMFKYNGGSWSLLFDIYSGGTFQFPSTVSTIEGWANTSIFMSFDMSPDCTKGLQKFGTNNAVMRIYSFDYSSNSSSIDSGIHLGSGYTNIGNQSIAMTDYQEYDTGSTDVYDATFEANGSFAGSLVAAYDVSENLLQYGFKSASFSGSMQCKQRHQSVYHYNGNPPGWVNTTWKWADISSTETFNLWGVSLVSKATGSLYDVNNYSGTGTGTGEVSGQFTCEGWSVHSYFPQSRCAVAVYRPQLIANGSTANEDIGFATGGESGAVDGLILIVNGIAVANAGNIDTPVVNATTIEGMMFTSTIATDPEVSRVITARDSCKYPVRAASDGTVSVSPKSMRPGVFCGYMDSYMDVAADMAGNAMAITKQTVSGSRVRYMTNGTFESLFSGHDIAGLRVVGMV